MLRHVRAFVRLVAATVGRVGVGVLFVLEIRPEDTIAFEFAGHVI
jgi:hypothetical protein